MDELNAILLKLDSYPNWEIQRGCWGAKIDELNLKNVVSLACNIFARYFTRERISDNNVKIFRDPFAKPMCMTREENAFITQHDFWIRVNSEGNKYCKLIYQLSHEVSHCLMRNYPKILKFKWLSEVIAEATSFLVLEKSKDIWKKSPQLKKIIKAGSNIPYWFTMQGYLNNALEKQDLRNLNESSQDFFKRFKESFEFDPIGLEKDGYRPRNLVLSRAIYKQLNNNLGWSAMKYFSEIVVDSSTSLEDFFGSWIKLCNTVEAQFVIVITNIVGINLSNNQ